MSINMDKLKWTEALPSDQLGVPALEPMFEGEQADVAPREEEKEEKKEETEAESQECGRRPQRQSAGSARRRQWTSGSDGQRWRVER